jgi:uncharacterized protein
MTRYVMWGSYCEDVLERRTPYRQAHLERLAALKTAGQLITVGPTKDLKKVLAIYEAESEAIARQFVEADPYWQQGIWTEYQLSEWIQVL